MEVEEGGREGGRRKKTDQEPHWAQRGSWSLFSLVYSEQCPLWAEGTSSFSGPRTRNSSQYDPLWVCVCVCTHFSQGFHGQEPSTPSLTG